MTHIIDLAIDAARSARDAHGAGNEPSAQIAYEFQVNLWFETGDPRWESTAQYMPPTFPALYDAALHGENELERSRRERKG